MKKFITILLAGLIALAGMVTVAPAMATTPGHGKTAICHPVEGKGETGNGWNIISPNKASSHINEKTGEAEHVTKDGRKDVYADAYGKCPGKNASEPTPKPTATTPVKPPVKVYYQTKRTCDYIKQRKVTVDWAWKKNKWVKKVTYGRWSGRIPTQQELEKMGCVTPTPEPTSEPTSEPTTEPTETPTTEPTSEPTTIPTPSEPTSEPSESTPTESPSTPPTSEPTDEPSTPEPSETTPTDEPTSEPPVELRDIHIVTYSWFKNCELYEKTKYTITYKTDGTSVVDLKMVEEVVESREPTFEEKTNRGCFDDNSFPPATDSDRPTDIGTPLTMERPEKKAVQKPTDGVLPNTGGPVTLGGVALAIILIAMGATVLIQRKHKG